MYPPKEAKMTIQPQGTAPYAPPKTVLDLIDRYRERGLSKPFDADVLGRASVPQSLIPRTLQALRLLDLIDEGGYPTDAFEDLARASKEQYRERLEHLVRHVYADVFMYYNPEVDGAETIRDVFRSYNPRGQKDRMVTLFLGLCEAAGIIEAIPKRQPGPKRSASRGTRAPTSGKSAKSRSARGGTSSDLDELTAALGRAPLLAGLLAELPAPGTPLTGAQRSRYVILFGTLLDFYHPVSDAEMMVESGAAEEVEQGEG
jgi:hypothetical protein